MRLTRLFAAAASTAMAAGLIAAGAPAQASHLPESNAEALEILADYYQGYWWDHTDLTVAVQTVRKAKPRYIAAVHDAIETWDSVLREEFDDLITLTDVTNETRNKQKADIVLHYAPSAGGQAFSGYALCGASSCHNILVTSDFAGEAAYRPEYLGFVTLHELGHALGLGHATNLEESTDLMGYGWSEEIDPVMSDCDLDAVKYVFGWAFDGTDPVKPPENGPYDCSQS
ncbi:MAG TPA: matrixin family metalloprotease [Actinomycetes bacterium]|nr:matrixin family metalloprotease [Actinomycetes bacterium]